MEYFTRWFEWKHFTRNIRIQLIKKKAKYLIEIINVMSKARERIQSFFLINHSINKQTNNQINE